MKSDKMNSLMKIKQLILLIYGFPSTSHKNIRKTLSKEYTRLLIADRRYAQTTVLLPNLLDITINNRIHLRLIVYGRSSPKSLQTLVGCQTGNHISVCQATLNT